MRVVLETEVPGDQRSLFRLTLNSQTVGSGLTAAQAHLLIGETLERATLPDKPSALKAFAAMVLSDPMQKPTN